MKLPDTRGKVNLDQVPKEIRNAIENNGPTPEVRDAGKAREHIAFYYANLAEMDENLGRVLNALRELNLEKDTIVLYTADHGDMLGEHGLWQKFVFYESSGIDAEWRAIANAGEQYGRASHVRGACGHCRAIVVSMARASEAICAIPPLRATQQSSPNTICAIHARST